MIILKIYLNNKNNENSKMKLFIAHQQNKTPSNNKNQKRTQKIYTNVTIHIKIKSTIRYNKKINMVQNESHFRAFLVIYILFIQF